MKPLSTFAERFTRSSGISDLMHDLNEAISSHDPNVCMLGGGNPAIIPAAMDVFRKEYQHLLDSQALDQSLAYYSSPQGDLTFIEILCEFFNDHYGWQISPKNIALSNGSQNSFFYLFNTFAGDMADGKKKKILFPLAPEYIGYRDLGLSDDMFVAVKPSIEQLTNGQFKYHIDFDALTISDDIAAICVSRPTNPTGNVISDDELNTLDKLAQQHNIPLIIDNAYGLPFPGTIYTDTKIQWHNNLVLGLSLSKLGLPGVRTGIIIAEESLIRTISSMNGTLCLAPNNMGASLVSRLIQSKEILTLRDTVIRPFYEHKMHQAIQWANTLFCDITVYTHKPEGAFFLWLWFPDLTISTKALYQILKDRKVYIIPGEDFFIGIDQHWAHQYQCIRINYALSDEQLKRGLKIIAEEVKKHSYHKI
jgi:valine--pyruvate aminotransferase